MSSKEHHWSRTVVGFIVEGHGEYYGYPPLASKIVGTPLNVFCLRAKGCGDILKNLEEHLDDMVLSHHPWSVIVTVDMVDCLSEKLKCCTDIKYDLESKIVSWRIAHEGDEKLNPLPSTIHVVLQCPKYESWMIAHAEALNDARLIELDGDFVPWGDVDTEELQPDKWLERRTRQKAKNPLFQKGCLSCSDIDVIRQRSRSFRKFSKEVMSAYEGWIKAGTQT